MFSAVFRAEEVDGVGDKVSEGTTTVDVKTLLDTCLERVPEICPTEEAFCDKKHYFWSWELSQVLDYQDLQIIRCQIK